MIRAWNRGCKRWRKTCIRRLAQNYQQVQRGRRIRFGLTAALSIELFCLAGIVWQKNEPKLNLIRRAEICEMELIPKTTDDFEELRKQDIYGIRLDLKAFEVQFYHREDLLQ